MLSRVRRYVLRTALVKMRSDMFKGCYKLCNVKLVTQYLQQGVEQNKLKKNEGTLLCLIVLWRNVKSVAKISQARNLVRY